MTEERIHRAVSDDGTEIAGRVHGEGPPLVFLHGIVGDGDLDGEPLIARLRDRFTCYLMHMRGRGAGGASADHGRERLVEDAAAFVDSIGESVGVVGFSSGGALALATAVRTDRVGLFETALAAA